MFAQVLAAVSVYAFGDQLEYHPDFRNGQGRVIFNIDNPETRQTQYHTADFERSE